MIWLFSDIFLMVRLGHGFEEEDHRGKVPLSSHHNKGTYFRHGFLLLMLTLGTCLPKFVKFLCCEVTFPPSYTLLFERKFPMHGTHLGAGDSVPLPGGQGIDISYLEFFCVELSLPLHSSVHISMGPWILRVNF